MLELSAFRVEFAAHNPPSVARLKGHFKECILVAHAQRLRGLDHLPPGVNPMIVRSFEALVTYDFIARSTQMSTGTSINCACHGSLDHPYSL